MTLALLHRSALRPRRLAVLAVTVGLALTAGALAAPVAGADAPPPQTNQWALTPTGDNPTEPSTRTTLSYELMPGATVDDSVTVWNYSDHPLSFRVYATDAVTTDTGAYDLLPRVKPPTDVGSWVKLTQENVTVPGHAGRAIPMTISVPVGATPGDHSGGVVASLTNDQAGADGKQIQVENRTGTRLLARVGGALDPRLVVEHVSSTYHRSPLALTGTLDVTYTVRNAGNIRLGAHRLVRVDGVFGWRLKSQDVGDLPELLPGVSVTTTAHLDGVLPAILLTTEVVLTPFSATGTVEPDPPRATGSATVWAIPWWLVILLVIILALAIWRRRVRSRRRQTSGRQGGRTSGGGDAGEREASLVGAQPSRPPAG